MPPVALPMKTFLSTIPGTSCVLSLYVLCQNSLIYTSHAQTLSLHSRQTLSMLGSVGLHLEAIKPEVLKLPVGHCGGENICGVLSRVQDCLLGPDPH